MHSRKLILASMLMTGCGTGSNDYKGSNVIGTPLTGRTQLYDSYDIATSDVFIVDKPTNRILGVNLDSFTITRQFSLSQPDEDHSVVVDIGQKFIIDFSKKHLEVISMDGARQSKPFSFQGTPVAAAYNPSARTMVMQDDLNSIGLMKFSETGEITGSWLGGPAIAGESVIKAGDIDKSGRLVVAMSDNSLIIADVDESIAKKSWQTTNFTVSTTGLEWIAPDNSQTDLLLVSSPTAVAIINLATKTAVDSKTINGSIIGRSKAGKPHVLAGNKSEVKLYYIGAGGKIAEKSLTNPDPLTNYRQSYLSSDGSTFTSLTYKSKSQNAYTEPAHRVLRIRLADNLVAAEQTISSYGTVAISPTKMFLDQESGLGALELHDLDSEDVKKLQGYNFDYLRSR